MTRFPCSKPPSAGAFRRRPTVLADGDGERNDNVPHQ